MLPTYKIVQTSLGVTSILSVLTGEIMHNPVGPWEEANHLYIKPSKLEQRLREKPNEELVVFDVGLGAAANALALLHKIYGAEKRVRILSFEIELNLIKFALENHSYFPFFEKFKNALETLLDQGRWDSENVSWELYEGSFLDTVETVSDHGNLVYFDPYSPKKNPEMWTWDCFKKLYGKTEEDLLFLNYSQATPVRAALLAAGFFVGYGQPTGKKESTTQAAKNIGQLEAPLDARWFQRWSRSDRPVPPGCIDVELFKEKIKSHPQFRMP